MSNFEVIVLEEPVQKDRVTNSTFHSTHKTLQDAMDVRKIVDDEWENTKQVIVIDDARIID